MAILSYTLECRSEFLWEKRNKSYGWYDDVSIALKNSDMCQELQRSGQLRWPAGWRGV